MRKKKIIVSGSIAAVIALSAASTAFGGCSLVSSNSSADMSQVIAEVDISESARLDENLAAYSSAIGSSNIYKRELVAFFLNAGYSYVQSGMSYEKVFTMLMDQLAETSVLSQYATMYLLDNKAQTGGESASAVIAKYNGFEKDSEKYEYLLGCQNVGTENVVYSDDVKIAQYSLLSSLNSAIDSYEQRILDETSSSSGSDTRSTPAGVDSEKDDYYPKDEDGNLDYNVYTGYEGYLLTQSGAYQDDCLEGTRRSTRIRAYNNFISSLASSSYDLVDSKNENLRDLLSLNYIQDEYVSQLKQRVIDKYYDLYEEEQEEKLLGGDDYGYIQSVYEDMLGLQNESYVSESAFSSAVSSMSDSSFVLYAPTKDDLGIDGKYGFVYNILLPFSAAQSAYLSELKTLYADENADGGYKPEYYISRNSVLKNIRTTDQRAAWFNGSTEYAYHKDGVSGVDYYGNSGWLFFENNLEKTGRYESLEKYDGRYAYNGKVYETENDYILVPNKLDIDEMLQEFMNYVNFAVGESVVNPSDIAPVSGYYNISADNLYKDNSVKDKKINYANFIYASGNVHFAEDDAYNRANVLNKDSAQYKALSAVNELQYAYTTDTGVLSQYLGYTVDAGDTDYIKEFEYAAHDAINRGAGSFAVCAGDYGWHLIYVTYTFDNESGNQYTPDWANNAKVEGTFENLFYEMIKSNDIADISTTRRTEIITKFKNDDTVKTYQSRYQDLLDLNNDKGNNVNNGNNGNNGN